ncbi:YwiB family protein [Paenibacillus sp. CAU 1782]
MNERAKVQLVLESRVDGQKEVHRYKGEWFRKEKSIYIRYAEGEGNQALLRYTPGELSLKRSGGITSEQLFVPGQSRIGSYSTPQAVFRLETETSSLVVKRDAAETIELPESLPFQLEWRYELKVGGQIAGNFHICLHIQEELEG